MLPLRVSISRMYMPEAIMDTSKRKRPSENPSFVVLFTSLPLRLSRRNLRKGSLLFNAVTVKNVLAGIGANKKSFLLIVVKYSSFVTTNPGPERINDTSWLPYLKVPLWLISISYAPPKFSEIFICSRLSALLSPRIATACCASVGSFHGKYVVLSWKHYFFSCKG